MAGDLGDPVIVLVIMPEHRRGRLGGGGDEKIGDLDAAVVEPTSAGQLALDLEGSLELLFAARKLMQGEKLDAEPVVVGGTASGVQDLQPDLSAGGERIGRQPLFPCAATAGCLARCQALVSAR